MVAAWKFLHGRKIYLNEHLRIQRRAQAAHSLPQVAAGVVRHGSQGAGGIRGEEGERDEGEVSEAKCYI
jgi:hypothetical protein